MLSRWGIVAALLLLSVGSGPATADATLVGSQPADGATLSQRPDTVTLDFAARILPPADVAVLAPDGRRVETGDAAVLDTRVQQQFSSAANGRFTVTYRVVGEDRHPVEGQIVFTVDAPVEAAPSWMSRYGAQLVGFGVVLALVVAIAALRLRPQAIPTPPAGSGGAQAPE